MQMVSSDAENILTLWLLVVSLAAIGLFILCCYLLRERNELRAENWRCKETIKNLQEWNGSLQKTIKELQIWKGIAQKQLRDKEINKNTGNNNPPKNITD